MQRYMVVTHPEDDQKLDIVDNIVVGGIPIHCHLQNYHWHRMDKDHVFLFGNFPIAHYNALHNHDKVSVLPHAGSSRPLAKHFREHIKHAHSDHHKQALFKHLDLNETHTLDDLIDKAVAKHGALFAPST